MGETMQTPEQIALDIVDHKKPSGANTTRHRLLVQIADAIRHERARAERLAAECRAWRWAHPDWDDPRQHAKTKEQVNKARAAVDAARDLPADGENKETT